MQSISAALPTLPVAEVKPMTFHTHDDIRQDDYFWLRERENPAVLDYLHAENAYTEAALADTAALQEQLYQEMRGRIKERDQSAAVERKGYLYYERTEEGQQYPIYCRRQGSMDVAEQILLDLNQLAEGQEYLRMANFAISPDQRLLAYGLDTNGSEQYTLRIKDLETGTDLADAIPGTYYGVAWANDNRTLYYTTVDEAMRPHKLFRHTLGTDPSQDALIHHEADEAFFLWVRKSKSEQVIFLTLESKVTSEIQTIDANDPQAAPQMIQSRIREMEYQASHHVDRHGRSRYFILTNWEATNFRVMVTEGEQPGREHWQEVIPHKEGVMIEGVECFQDHLVLYELENGLSQIRVCKIGEAGELGEQHRITFNDPVYTAQRGSSPNFESNKLRYIYSSLIQPETTYDYHMNERYQILRKEQEVPGYHPGQYRVERLWATAQDGAQIPISLVAPVDLALDGNNPTLLYGYGSYGVTIDPGFRSNIISLLDRGFTFAIAHIRGGGEMGRAWYEQGKYLHKKNTFTDFIAAAEHLIAQGYTRPERLAIMGRSAGGLLMGAVTNLRPDLFRAVVAGVPFVDVINTMMDPSIPLTVMEYEEWGNPNDPDYYAYMKSYSPYDNLAPVDYPAILATAGLNDPRVQYWEPAKWVAKLRRTKTDANLLLLKTNMGAGHAGASGRFDYLKELALEYAFILKMVGEPA
jgi:oligopeptidase B